MSNLPTKNLLSDLRQLIDGARHRAAAAINSELVTLYWHLGNRIRTDLLQEDPATYDEKIMTDLGRSLSVEYGRGFNVRNLHRMVRFAETFPDEQIVTAPRTQLSWTHFREIIFPPEARQEAA